MKTNLRKFIILFALTMTTTLAFAAEQKPAPKKVLNIQQWSSKNGAQVYFVRAKQLPMVDIKIVFHAGSARDGDKFGLASITNSLLNQSTGKLSADDIADQLDSVGAQYYASVDRDAAEVSLRSLSDKKYLQPALKTFAAIVSDPTFPNKAFYREQKLAVATIKQKQQSPVYIANNAFFKALYGDHPYSHPVLGTIKTVNDLSSKDVKRFYKKYYVAANAIIAIVGDVSVSDAHSIAEQITANLSKGREAPALSKAKSVDDSITKKIQFPSTQTTILIGQLGINRQSPNYFPLYVGNYILGGGMLVSRLFEHVREQQGLVYGIYSFFNPLPALGPFQIQLQTRNNKAKDALQITNQVVDSFIADGPDNPELTAAKQNIVGGFPLQFASNSSIADKLLNLGFYHLPLDYYDTFSDKVSAVTMMQVQQAFKQQIDPNKMITIMVGDFSHDKAELDKQKKV